MERVNRSTCVLMVYVYSVGYDNRVTDLKTQGFLQHNLENSDSQNSTLFFGLPPLPCLSTSTPVLNSSLIRSNICSCCGVMLPLAANPRLLNTTDAGLLRGLTLLLPDDDRANLNVSPGELSPGSVVTSPLALSRIIRCESS